MPRQIMQKTIDKVKKIIEKEDEISKYQLMKLSGVGGRYLDEVLNILEKDSSILIAKVQTFNDNKVVNQSFNVKFLKMKK